MEKQGSEKKKKGLALFFGISKFFGYLNLSSEEYSISSDDDSEYETIKKQVITKKRKGIDPILPF